MTNVKSKGISSLLWHTTTAVGIVSMLRKGVLQCLVSANYLLYNVVGKKRLFNTEIYMSMVFLFLRVSHKNDGLRNCIYLSISDAEHKHKYSSWLMTSVILN